jgi:hypothetical protein
MPKHTPNVERDLRDPQNVAIEITEQRGLLAMLSREVSTSNSNLSSTLQAVQADVRHMGDKLADVARLQHEQVSHSEGLGRAFQAIERLANEFSGWRKDHEDENDATSRKVTWFSGGVTVLTLVGGLLIAALLWNYDQGRAGEARERSILEARIDRNAADLGARIDRAAAEADARLDALEGRRER